MSEAKTILDYLNEDCWRAVLRHVSVSDVIRTERVSRRWQHVVLTYLSDVRIGIGRPGKDKLLYNESNEIKIMTTSNVHWLAPPTREACGSCGSFESWTYKMGESIVAACCGESIFNIIGENCPNLEEARFTNLREELLGNSQHENFKRLRRLYFTRCHVSDSCIKQYMTSNLEELQIERNLQVTGQCLINSTAHLKSLVIRECSAFSCRHLLAASDSFDRLKKLVLVGIRREWDDFQHLLPKTPKLEHLEVDDRNKGICIDNLFTAVCQLRSLRRLSLEALANNEDLEAVTRCCPELKYLSANCLTVTSEGLAAVCRNAGPRLISLGLEGSQLLKDRDVVACINECPNLMELNVRDTWLSCDLLPRAACARRGMRARRPLRLLLDWQELHDHPACPHQEYPSLTEEYDELEFPPKTPMRSWSPPTIDEYGCSLGRRTCTALPDGRIDLEKLRSNFSNFNYLLEGLEGIHQPS